MTFHVPNQYRIRSGNVGSTDLIGNNGAFFIPYINSVTKRKIVLGVIAADCGEWEHVSVSLQNRCPYWVEMEFVKSLFWDPEDCVMQLHVPNSEHINRHNFCLHMWRPKRENIPVPPSWMV